MFAPYCSHCCARVLLGAESIVAYDSADGRHAIVLRCRCDQLVSWDAAPPRSAVAVPSPAEAPPRRRPRPLARRIEGRWAAAYRAHPAVGVPRSTS